MIYVKKQSVLYLAIFLILGQFIKNTHATQIIDVEATIQADILQEFIPKQIHLQGNTLLSKQDLNLILQSYQGKHTTLNGLQKLASEVTQAYHQAGYPLVSVIIPPQRMEDGVLTLQVIETKVGHIELNNQSRVSDKVVTDYLSAVKTDQTLNQKDSERALLLLKDLAGTQDVQYRLSADTQGTVLNVDLGEAPAVDAFVQVDNYGSQSTGKVRARAGLNLNSAFGRGERLSLQAMSSFKGVNFARLGLDLPVGAQGTSLNTALAHTRYDLGGDFKDLDATGTADTLEMRITHPMLRGQSNSVWLDVGSEYRKLEDNIGATQTTTNKSLRALRTSIYGNHQGRYLSGAYLQWRLDGGFGYLDIDSAIAKVIDRQSAKTQGTYAKLNANLSYTQYLSPRFSIKTSANAQWANKNLDSAEQISLGGVDHLAAYHSNDFSADSGVIGQIEARYALSPAFSVSAFYDGASAKLKHTPYTQAVNRVNLHGAGLGVYAQHKGTFLQAKAAWALGDTPESIKKPSKPYVWIKTGYQF